MKKRGKWGEPEDAIILDGLKNNQSPEEIQQKLNDFGCERNLKTLERRMDTLQLKHNLQDNKHATKDLRTILHSKEYWIDLTQQFDDNELQYFEAIWVELMQQFREDVLASEEMQLKQYITLDILMKRSMIDRNKHVETISRLEKLLDDEYEKDDDLKDVSIISNLEQQLSIARNSVASYTTEFTKLLDKFQSIGKDLKANRDARIKRIEDSKSTWVGLVRALNDYEMRKRLGEEIEVMKIAKDHSKSVLSDFYKYGDGMIDQPLLNADTVQDDEENDE